jgi:hypothetical protein
VAGARLVAHAWPAVALLLIFAVRPVIDRWLQAPAAAALRLLHG